MNDSQIAGNVSDWMSKCEVYMTKCDGGSGRDPIMNLLNYCVLFIG